MRVLILGAAGMLGRKLTQRLLRDGALGGVPVRHLDLADVVAAAAPAQDSITIAAFAVDISDAKHVNSLIARQPDVIFHLAAIVSGEAETEFEKGYAINLDATRFALKPSGALARPIVQDWCSRLQLRCLVHRSRTKLKIPLRPRRSPLTAPKKPSANFCCPTIPARALLTELRCDFPPFA